jgi:hypothetical protein
MSRKSRARQAFEAQANAVPYDGLRASTYFAYFEDQLESHDEPTNRGRRGYQFT